MKYKVKVIVTLKNSVKDVRGITIDTVLKRMNFEKEANMQVGKYFSFNLTSNNEEEAKEKLKKICDELLTNPILEEYQILDFSKEENL